MRSKQICKYSVDVVMTVLFLAQMAYHITGNGLHEWLGVLLFALFLLHHALNIKWYASLFKGRYSGLRILMVTVNFLLLAAMIGTMISGIMLSREVFDFLNLRAGMLGRRLHMISTAWGYLLMAVHLGLHFGMILAAFRRKIHPQNRIVCAVGRIAPFLIAAYGVYAFFVRQLADRMFLLMEYAFFDYEEPAIFFFGDYLCILFLFALLAYYLTKLLKSKKRSEAK